MKAKLRPAKVFRDNADVLLIGNHPHSGKTGTIKGNIHTSKVFGWKMWLVELEDGSGGVFAPEKEMRLIK